MAGEVASTAEDRALDALTKILESAISPDMMQAQQVILRRLALSGDLFPSRVPAPANITQVGGYLNLIEKQPLLLSQVLAAALGVAGPNTAPAWEPTLPPLFFVTRTNDRPAGVAQAATPVHVSIRNDFATALDAALATIHDRGCTLPLLATNRLLPPATPGAVPPTDLLPYLGRALELVPGAALVDPATDPLALGQPGGGGSLRVLARQLDATAPGAASVVAAVWSVWTCTPAACSQSSVTLALLDLTPILNGAGWYQLTPPTAPVSLGSPGNWHFWRNITGLVAGASTVGEELGLLYPIGMIAQSSLRERLDWVWDGSTFVAPA